MLDNTNMGGGDGRTKYSHILQDVMLASSILYFVGGLKAALWVKYDNNILLFQANTITVSHFQMDSGILRR